MLLLNFRIFDKLINGHLGGFQLLDDVVVHAALVLVHLHAELEPLHLGDLRSEGARVQDLLRKVLGVLVADLVILDGLVLEPFPASGPIHLVDALLHAFKAELMILINVSQLVHDAGVHGLLSLHGLVDHLNLVHELHLHVGLVFGLTSLQKKCEKKVKNTLNKVFLQYAFRQNMLLIQR